MGGNANLSSPKPGFKNWKEVVSLNKEAYKIFMQFLCKEFSVENLAFITYFIQFCKYVKKSLKNEVSEEILEEIERWTEMGISFPKGPLSFLFFFVGFCQLNLFSCLRR